MKYKLDKTHTHIENIPYEEYIRKQDIPENCYLITDYGARTDGDFVLNRKAMQTAIDAAFNNGGGIVLVSGGNYKCANIELKSNITLFISADSSLENITYDEDRTENKAYTKKSNGFIFAKNARNVRITGGGKLIGNGETYTKEPSCKEVYYPLESFSVGEHYRQFKKRIRLGRCHEKNRYYMLELEDCENCSVQNLIITDAGSWTCRMKACVDLTVSDVVIDNNLHVANSDGIDILGGKNIRIEHCFIATGDDGACLKTEDGSGEIDGVTVRNCEIMSNASAFKIGTGTYNNISNVTVENCSFFMAEMAGGYCGISIEAVDGGTVRDIAVKNITMENVVCPFLIWLGKRHGKSHMMNITLKDISAENIDMTPSVVGSKGVLAENIKISNVDVTYRNCGEAFDIFKGDSCARFFNVYSYPESINVSKLGGKRYDLPCYGLFAVHVDVCLKNYQVEPRECNKRQKFNIEFAPACHQCIKV